MRFNLTVDPDWASFKLGIFVCLNCSGTHRNLPAISRIKSIRLDNWDDDLVEVGSFSSRRVTATVSIPRPQQTKTKTSAVANSPFLQCWGCTRHDVCAFTHYVGISMQKDAFPLFLFIRRTSSVPLTITIHWLPSYIQTSVGCTNEDTRAS